MRKLKVKETSHELSQFTTVTSPPAVPFKFIGNIQEKNNNWQQKSKIFKVNDKIKKENMKYEHFLLF